jgi:hypothetical protein
MSKQETPAVRGRGSSHCGIRNERVVSDVNHLNANGLIQNRPDVLTGRIHKY